MTPTATARDRRDAWRAEGPIRAWRARRSLSIPEAAGKLGVSAATIQLWEYGANVPNDENLSTIARTLRTSVARLRDDWTAWIETRP